VKPAAYFIVLLLAVASLGLSIALWWVGRGNLDLQNRLQAQQQALNSGILGQQGQQISGNLLQDLAAAAATNASIRGLLDQHGYRVPTAGASSDTGAVPWSVSAPATAGAEERSAD